jgi:hypothetical protein
MASVPDDTRTVQKSKQSYFMNRTLHNLNRLPSVCVSPVDTDVDNAVHTCLQLLAVTKFEFERVHMNVVSDDNDSNLIVRLRNAPPAFMNLLRISFADVPVMVIDEVTFKQVPLVVPTQLLAHRFGLLPVFVDPYTLDIPTLTFCAEGQVSSRQLQPVQAPKRHARVNVSSYPVHKDPYRPDCLHGARSVHSDRSCVSRWPSSNISVIGHRDVYPPNRPVVEAGVTITYLQPTQKIEGTARISRQTARTHAKAQAAKVFFRMHAVPVVNENSGVIDKDSADKLREKCKAGVFQFDDDTSPAGDESTWLRAHNSVEGVSFTPGIPISSSSSSSTSRHLKVEYDDAETKTAMHVTGREPTFRVRSHLCTSCGQCGLPLREDENDHILLVTSTSGLTANSVFYDALQICKTYFD